MNKDRKLLLFVALALVVILVADWMQPRPVNWSQSYSSRDTIPYGAYGLFRVLPELFPGSEISTIGLPAYDWLSRRNTGLDESSMLIYINNNLVFDQFETGLLLDFADRGGTVFMSAEQFSDPLADSLGIRLQEGMMSNLGLRGIDLLGDRDSDSTGISVVREITGGESPIYRFPSFLVTSIITRYDTLNTKILGVGEREAYGFSDKDAVNYIAIKRGAGTIYVHTSPATLTNYFLVDDGKNGYIWDVMTQLPDRHIYWDEYKKVMTAEAQTPLRFILSITTLRYALYLGLAILLLFILFSAKRRQSVIPIHRRPVNATVSFVKTVTNLFFGRADHRDLAERKIIYLFDYFRRELGLEQVPGETITPKAVAARSGIEEQMIEDLFSSIAAVRDKSFIGANELKSLNTQIETFYKTTQR
ncbi:MAG: DUF4350 domain-containing protein [Balneolaceae bacterium]|nr:MAG: DUF4350 domain-containing protein [Balneolaceae bacterium]